MSNAVLEVFDASLQKTQVWLNERADWEEKPQKACLALRTALHALRDRLTVEESRSFGRTTTDPHTGCLLRGMETHGKAREGAP